LTLLPRQSSPFIHPFLTELSQRIMSIIICFHYIH
jgi:hypothetical protein